MKVSKISTFTTRVLIVFGILVLSLVSNLASGQNLKTRLTLYNQKVSDSISNRVGNSTIRPQNVGGRYTDLSAIVSYLVDTIRASGGATIDTTALSNRINLKLNITDTTPLHNQIVLRQKYTDTVGMSNRINARQPYSDTSTYDATRAWVNTNKVAYTDSGTVYVSKYGIDTAKNAIRTVQAGKINYTDSGSVYYSKYGVDSAKSNIRTSLSTKINYSDTLNFINTKSGTNLWTGSNTFNPSISGSTGNIIGTYIKGTTNISGAGNAEILRVGFTGAVASTGITKLIALYGRDSTTIVAYFDSVGRLVCKGVSTTSGGYVMPNGNSLTNGGSVGAAFTNQTGVTVTNSYSALASRAMTITKQTNDATLSTLIISSGSSPVGQDSFLADGTACIKNIRVIGTAPTIAAGVGAGTSPTISISGNDNAFTVTLTTGTSPTAASTIFTVTYNLAKAKAPVNIFSAKNLNAAGVSGVTYVSSETTTTVVFTGTLAASTQYIWTFHNLETAN